MVTRIIFLVSAILAGICFTHAAHSAPAKGVRTEKYNGWETALIMNSSPSKARAVVVPAISGRVVHYGFKGENVLYEPLEGRGKTLEKAREGFPVGGYHCDLGPETGGAVPEHRLLWFGAYTWRTPRPSSVIVTSESSAATGIQIEKEIVLDPDSGELGLVQSMRNISDKETAYCIWDRTLCPSGGYALVPLNPKSRFPSGWSIRRVQGGQDVFDGSQPVSPQVQVIQGILVAETKGPATKIGADSDAHWVAYVRGKVLFVKYFPYFAQGHYSDGGNSVKISWDDKAVGLEPLSPEITLPPGERYSFPEKWMLFPLKDDVKSAEQAAALARRVPPSPFQAE